MKKPILKYIIFIILFFWSFFVFKKFYAGVEPRWLPYIGGLVTAGILFSFFSKNIFGFLKKVLWQIFVVVLLSVAAIIFLLYPKESFLIILSCFSWFVLGKIILDRFIGGVLPKLDKIVFSLSIGMVLFSFIILGLGVIGRLYPIYLLIVLGIISCYGISRYYKFFLGFKKLYSEIKEKFIIQSNIGIIFIVLISLHFFIFTVGNLTPPTLVDDIVYHLSSCKIFAQNHKIFFLPFFTHFNLPFSLEMLFTLGMVLGSEYIFAGLVNIVFIFLLLSSFFITGRRFFHSLSGPLSFLFLFSIPYYNIHGFSMSVDLKFLVYCILAFYSFLSWIETKDENWLWITGIMLGLSLNFRYHGVIPLAFFFIILLFNHGLKWKKFVFLLSLFF